MRLLADGEFDEDYATEIQLNEIYDAVDNVFTLFEADGVSANSFQVMLQIHNNLRALDGIFNAFELLDIAPEG